MIPRKILKIRQIELRPNRLVKHLPVDGSLQTAAQSRWIPRAVPDCNHLDFGVNFVDCEIDLVRPAENAGPASFEPSIRKLKRRRRNRRNYHIHFKDESNSESSGLVFIPFHRLLKFKRGLGAVDDPKTHSLYLASVSSRSFSQGVPRPGFFSASSARRSSSAFCSAVSSSSKGPNSNPMVATSSRLSASGIRRISSRISALLTARLYRATLPAQAGFGPLHGARHATGTPGAALRIPNFALP